jgi:hypothetical protein
VSSYLAPAILDHGAQLPLCCLMFAVARNSACISQRTAAVTAGAAESGCAPLVACAVYFEYIPILDDLMSLLCRGACCAVVVTFVMICTSPGAHEPWRPRALAPTSPGTHEPWHPRALAPTSPGTHEPWHPRALAPTSPGTHEPWRLLGPRGTLIFCHTCQRFKHGYECALHLLGITTRRRLM